MVDSFVTDAAQSLVIFNGVEVTRVLDTVLRFKFSDVQLGPCASKRFLLLLLSVMPSNRLIVQVVNMHLQMFSKSEPPLLPSTSSFISSHILSGTPRVVFRYVDFDNMLRSVTISAELRVMQVLQVIVDEFFKGSGFFSMLFSRIRACRAGCITSEEDLLERLIVVSCMTVHLEPSSVDGSIMRLTPIRLALPRSVMRFALQLRPPELLGMLSSICIGVRHVKDGVE